MTEKPKGFPLPSSMKVAALNRTWLTSKMRPG